MKVAGGRGRRPADRGRTSWCGRCDAARAGAAARPPATSPWRDPLPGRDGDRRRARRAHLRRDAPSAPTRWPTRCSEPASSEGDGVAIMCRNHRGFVDATVAVAKLGADILYLNTAFAGPQLVDVSSARSPRRSSTTRSSPSLLEDAGERRKRVVAWARRRARRRPDTVEELIEQGDPDATSCRRREHGRIVILTSGTTGTPKGAPRNEAGIDAAVVAALADAAAPRQAHPHRGAAVPHLGLRALRAGACCSGSTVVLRRKFDPEDVPARRSSEQRCDSLVVDPGDAAADHGAARGGRATATTLSSLKVVAASGSALPGDLATDWMDAVRRQPLQHLRLDRGRLRHDRHARGPARGARHGRQAAARHRREDPRRGRHRACRTGETGRIFVGNEMLFEGYTGGGTQGHGRRADVHRRRRPLRRRRAGCSSRAATTR